MPTGHALLGDDQVGLDGQDGLAHGLDLLLLNLQDAVPVLLLGDLNVGLRLALLVLERAVQQNDAGVLYAPAHLGVCDVLVEHDAVQHPAVLDLAAGHLLDAGIALDVHLGLAVARLPGDGAHGLEGERAHKVHPPRDELGADRGRDELVHGLVVVDVDGVGDLLDDLERVVEGALEGRDDDDGVDVSFELGEGVGENLTSWTSC